MVTVTDVPAANEIGDDVGLADSHGAGPASTGPATAAKDDECRRHGDDDGMLAKRLHDHPPM